MYYVLFRYKKGRCEKDYQGFRTEEALSLFLMEKGLEIHVDKIIESLAELKFGLSAIDSKDIEFIDSLDFFTEEAEKLRAEEKNEEVTDADIIRKNKEALDKADKAIAAAAADLKSGKREGWTVCPKCNVNKVAPWNKKGICSKCQKPPGKRKYKTRKKSKID